MARVDHYSKRHVAQCAELRAAIALILAELDAYRRAGLELPPARTYELLENLEGATFDAQPLWNDLAPESMSALATARSRLLAARELRTRIDQQPVRGRG